ncbi:MAG: tetratricopeptide repeat protein [Cyanobacteria bacterium]|nr:tetratricopeptide repeat protein [Cyanobacteriota bacterium]
MKETLRIVSFLTSTLLCSGCGMHQAWGPLSDWTKQYHWKLSERSELTADHSLVAGKRPTAVQWYQDSLKEARNANLSAVEIIDQEKDLAGALLVRGRFKDSLKYYDHAITALDRLNQPSPLNLKAKLTAGRGFALLFLGKRAESRHCFEDAIRLYERTKPREYIYDLPIDLCPNCCRAGLELTKIEKPWYEQRVSTIVCPTFPTKMLPAIRGTTGGAEDPAVQTRWQMIMGRAKHYDTTGKGNLARQCYEEAISFLKSRGVDDLRLATTYRTLSFLHAAHMNWPEANYYTTLEANYQKERFGSNDPSMAGILSRLGMIKMRLGESKESLRLLNEAIELAGKDGEVNELDGIVLRNLGVALLDNGQAAKARKCLLDSVAIMEKYPGRTNDRLCGAYVAMVECEMASGDVDGAEKYLLKASKLLKDQKLPAYRYKAMVLLHKIQALKGDRSPDTRANLREQWRKFSNEKKPSQSLLGETRQLHRELFLPKAALHKLDDEHSNQNSKQR